MRKLLATQVLHKLLKAGYVMSLVFELLILQVHNRECQSCILLEGLEEHLVYWYVRADYSKHFPFSHIWLAQLSNVLT